MRQEAQLLDSHSHDASDPSFVQVNQQVRRSWRGRPGRDALDGSHEEVLALDRQTTGTCGCIQVGSVVVNSRSPTGLGAELSGPL